MKSNLQKTFIDCDARCGAEEQEVDCIDTLDDNDNLLDVWYGLPPGWLNLISHSGGVVTVCSEKCALTLTTKQKEFWDNYYKSNIGPQTKEEISNVIPEETKE
jgi:hypothetical protein